MSAIESAADGGPRRGEPQAGGPQPGVPRRGVRLGVDVGSVRVGIAISDPDGILATPLVTLPRDLPADGDVTPSDIAAISALVSEREVVEVVLGLPINLAGKEGLAATMTRQYAELLAKHIDPVPIRLTDERMSTVTASRRLSERGVRGKRQRAVVDQAAAVEILQGWLDARRAEIRRAEMRHGGNGAD